MSKHTPEPWLYQRMATIEEKYSIGNSPNSRLTGEGQVTAFIGSKDNASRICAAVNACAGIPTEALEQGVVQNLIDAASDLISDLYNVSHNFGMKLHIQQLREAIVKARGQS